jgi:hypothetical protein
MVRADLASVGKAGDGAQASCGHPRTERLLAGYVQRGTAEMSDGRQELRQAFRRFEQEIPPWLASGLRWLRHPRSRLVRIPVGVLLMIGGVFAILPGLGVWMIPLGLLLLAADIPFLRRPVARFTVWSAEQWARFRGWLARRR